MVAYRGYGFAQLLCLRHSRKQPWSWFTHLMVEKRAKIINTSMQWFVNLRMSQCVSCSQFIGQCKCNGLVWQSGEEVDADCRDKLKAPGNPWGPTGYCRAVGGLDRLSHIGFTVLFSLSACFSIGEVPCVWSSSERSPSFALNILSVTIV